MLPLVSDAEQSVSDIATETVKDTILQPLKSALRRSSGLDPLSACLLRNGRLMHFLAY